MSSISLIDLLSAKKWENALFTTYALSLTFFETCVLRVLRQQGCRQISLVTDAVGYLSSLGERRSSRVGQEYQVIPVALPHGVFHPKCTYLAGPEGHALIIGSGNLTFGGYGRNLEVFEILEPHTAPTAFVDFAEFLEVLGQRHDIIIPDKDWIKQFSTLSRQQAQGHAPIQSFQPRVIHSVITPIVDQIPELIPEYGEKTLTVLSPFHDTEGAAVKQLATRTGVSNISIALPTRHASETTFPFPAVKNWSQALSAVTPSVDEPKRSLHAKWFEISCSSGPTITLTGSINATRKALCGTDNIEVGVLHVDTLQQNWVAWEKSAMPSEYTKLSYSSSGLGNNCLVYALLRSNGTLTGCLIASGSLTGTWVGFLESSGGDQFQLTVTVADGGKFATSIACTQQFLFAPGLQIVLEKEEQRARGWVIQQDILKLGPEQRTIVRFLNDEETVDDEVALLDYLAQSVNAHLDVFKTLIKHNQRSGDSDGPEKIAPPVTIYLAEIAPASKADDQKLEPGETAIRISEFDLLSRLRRYLLGERYASKREIHADVEPEDDEDQNEQREKQAKKKLIISKLDKFESSIRKCLSETRDSVRRRAALVYWFEVKLHMLKRHNLREEALLFVRDWFWKACAEKLYIEPREALEQHLFTTAAVEALVLPEGSSRQNVLIMIHDALEHFIGGAVDNDRALGALIDHPDVGFASFLVPDKATSLTSALHDILRTATFRSQLEQELERYKAGGHLDEKAHVFVSSHIGQVFLSALKSNSGVKIYQQVTPDSSSCPFCYMTLTTQAETDLKKYRIARCTTCSRFAINLVP